MSFLNNLIKDPKYQTSNPREPQAVSEADIISPDTRRENRMPPGQSRHGFVQHLPPPTRDLAKIIVIFFDAPRDGRLGPVCRQHQHIERMGDAEVRFHGAVERKKADLDRFRK